MITLYHRPNTRSTRLIFLLKSPVIEDYVKRVVGRPAYARAVAKQNG